MSKREVFEHKSVPSSTQFTGNKFKSSFWVIVCSRTFEISVKTKTQILLFFPQGTVMLKGIKFCSRWLIAVHSNEDDDEKNDAAHGSTNGNTDQFLWQRLKKTTEENPLCMKRIIKCTFTFLCNWLEVNKLPLIRTYVNLSLKPLKPFLLKSCHHIQTGFN